MSKIEVKIRDDIAMLLIVMMKKKKLQFQKKNFTQLKSEIKYCVMYIVQPIEL